MQGGRRNRKCGHKKRGNKTDEAQASRPIATAAQPPPASDIQPAHTSSEQTSVVNLYHTAVVLALALASMNGILGSSVVGSAQPLCISYPCIQLSEPNGLFRLTLASCVPVSRFQVVCSLTNGASWFLRIRHRDITFSFGCDLQAGPSGQSSVGASTPAVLEVGTGAAPSSLAITPDVSAYSYA